MWSLGNIQCKFLVNSAGLGVLGLRSNKCWCCSDVLCRCSSYSERFFSVALPYWADKLGILSRPTVSSQTMHVRVSEMLLLSHACWPGNVQEPFVCTCLRNWKYWPFPGLSLFLLQIEIQSVSSTNCFHVLGQIQCPIQSSQRENLWSLILNVGLFYFSWS